MFFGILFTYCRRFFDQRRTVFLNSWKELSSKNIVRLQLSFWSCSAHSTLVLWCSIVSIGVALRKLLLYPVQWNWRCTVHRDTLRLRFWRNFSAISSVVISLFRRIHWQIEMWPNSQTQRNPWESLKHSGTLGYPCRVGVFALPSIELRMLLEPMAVHVVAKDSQGFQWRPRIVNDTSLVSRIPKASTGFRNSASAGQIATVFSGVISHGRQLPSRCSTSNARLWTRSTLSRTNPFLRP